ncbi:hypothetical protein GCM10025759_16350 [Lysobacter panacisoli]|uniref:DUF2818 family protein n=2 Tax=Lysobacter panacisoli TaxID=1255263 RepID=A0ABP9LA35_9GAMM
MEGFVHDAVRFWTDLTGRAEGPMTFRFVLQPTMALLMAIRDGFKDAKIGRAPYFWTIVNDAHRRRASLDEGIEATARILALGLVMEIIYQYRVFGTFHVLEAVNFILLLCFIPYLVMRGPINRLAHWWMQRRHTNA